MHDALNETIARPALGVAASSGRLLGFVQLLKLRLNGLVLVAVGAGWVMAGPPSGSLGPFLALLAGVLLASGGASAMNMALEAELDAKMERTRGRPVPRGVLSKDEAMAFGSLCVSAGLIVVAAGSDVLAALLTGVVAALYVLAYTPLKTRSPLNTLVGAIPGALPPVVGWAAARGQVDAGALSLFAIVFLWQFPHFLAIASFHREDYARAGYAMLPVVDGGGRRTARHTAAAALLFVPAALLPAAMGLAGAFYAVGAGVLALAYLAFSVQAARRRSREAWRALLRASLVVLPVLFVLMISDRIPR